MPSDDTSKRGPGQPRKPDAKTNVMFRAHPDVIAAKEASGLTWEALVKRGLTTPPS